jgi:hypothetical protein
MAQPRGSTIRKVIEYLEEHGLSVYGPNANLETKIIYPACRDFNAEDAVKFCRIQERGGFTESDYDD